MRPTASRAAARKSLQKARRSLGRGGVGRATGVSRVAPQVTKPSRSTLASRTASRTTTARTTTTTSSSRLGAKRPAPSSRTTAAKAKAEEPKEEEEAKGDDASRVYISKKTGKLVVRGVDKFNKAERTRIIETVCAEKITECNRNSELINQINETLKTISAEKQKTEEEKKEIHKNYETKGMEFEALEDKYDSAKSENK